jgi:putative integral membrane protein (TIGR02587 family)
MSKFPSNRQSSKNASSSARLRAGDRHRRLSRPRPSTFKQELNDLVRGICGGFLFGTPLFYTMEVWWIGSSAEPPVLLAAIATMLLVVFVLNLTEGFRTTQTKTLKAALNDTIDVVAIGLVGTTWLLIIFQEVTLQTHLSAALGKIIFESVPLAIGAALTNQFLGGSEPSEAKSPSQLESLLPQNNLNATLADIGATMIGAVIIAFSIAPTDEVPMLAASTQGPWLLLIVLSSLVISYGIVFESNFTQQHQRRSQTGLFQSPLSETIMSYLVSLLVAALMLYFFQKIEPQMPWATTLSYILILGLPATIGGAAGRLAL